MNFIEISVEICTKIIDNYFIEISVEICTKIIDNYFIEISVEICTKYTFFLKIVYNMLVNLYDNINFNKIKFSSKPYKKEMIVDKVVRSIYFIDINYYKKPLYIQLPKLSIVKLEDSKIQIVIHDYLYQKFIKQIEELVIDKVYNNCETWFNKRFTIDKIISSLITQIQYKNNEYILELNYDNETIFYNQYKTQLNKSDIQLPIDIICIIRLENLQFIDNKFTYNIFLEQAKIIQKLRLKEYSILEQSLENETINKVSLENNTSNISLENNYYDQCSKESILDDEYYSENK